MKLKLFWVQLILCIWSLMSLKRSVSTSWTIFPHPDWRNTYSLTLIGEITPVPLHSDWQKQTFSHPEWRKHVIPCSSSRKHLFPHPDWRNSGNTYTLTLIGGTHIPSPWLEEHISHTLIGGYSLTLIGGFPYRDLRKHIPHSGLVGGKFKFIPSP